MKHRKKPKRELKFLPISLDIYRCYIVVTWGTTIEEIIAYGKKRGISTLTDEWKENKKEAMVNALGVCAHYGEKNSDILVWLAEKPTKMSTFGVMYHELTHALDYFSKDKGLEDEIETRACVMEYVINECHKVLWK